MKRFPKTLLSLFVAVTLAYLPIISQAQDLFSWGQLIKLADSAFQSISKSVNKASAKIKNYDDRVSTKRNELDQLIVELTAVIDKRDEVRKKLEKNKKDKDLRKQLKTYNSELKDKATAARKIVKDLEKSAAKVAFEKMGKSISSGWKKMKTAINNKYCKDNPQDKRFCP